MRKKVKMFARAFEHAYSQWFSTPGHEPPVDNKPLTIEELELSGEISDYLEKLYYQIIEEQDKNSKDKKQ